MDIAGNIRAFLEGEGDHAGRKPGERYAFFDYCYNHFQEYREGGSIRELAQPGHMHQACLHLVFYLASWGMLRGASFLLEKSVSFYQPLVRKIAEIDPRVWEIDIDCYTKENIGLLLECRDSLADSLGKENKPSDALITKIMMGVFGNVPVFDEYLQKGYSVGAFKKRSLRKVASFYDKEKERIDNIDIHTLDLLSGFETGRKYPKAKIVDIIGYVEGRKKLN